MASSRKKERTKYASYMLSFLKVAGSRHQHRFFGLFLLLFLLALWPLGRPEGHMKINAKPLTGLGLEATCMRGTFEYLHLRDSCDFLEAMLGLSAKLAMVMDAVQASSMKGQSPTWQPLLCFGEPRTFHLLHDPAL